MWLEEVMIINSPITKLFIHQIEFSGFGFVIVGHERILLLEDRRREVLDVLWHMVFKMIKKLIDFRCLQKVAFTSLFDLLVNICIHSLSLIIRLINW